MIVSTHALSQMNEMISKMDFPAAKQFVNAEVHSGVRNTIHLNDGRIISKVVNHNMVFILDESNPINKILLTVYSSNEEIG